MNTKGLRISDIKNDKCLSLIEILENIPNADQFYWALLWLDVTPMKKDGKCIAKLQQKVNQSEQGIPCLFEFLIEIANKIFQEIEVLIIACKNKKNLHRYEVDKKMYETCDIVIEIIDGGFWEIFSNDIDWIDELSKKYKQTEFLKSDFQSN